MNSPKPQTIELLPHQASQHESVQQISLVNESAPRELSRRDFLRAGAQCVACCAGGALLLSLSGCGSDGETEGNVPAAAATSDVLAVVPTENPKNTYTLTGSAKSPAGKALVFQTTAKEPIVVFQSGGKWQALSAKCTHSGCTVEWQKDAKERFVCPCHNSRFDEKGKVLGGPAKAPLPAYTVQAVGTDLVVKVA
jgi:Rieske Fe-S protein